MSPSVFRLFTTSRKPLIGIGLGGNVIRIITDIGDQSLDILRVRTVREIGHRCGLLFIIDIYFLDPFLMAEVFLDPFFTLLALYRGRFNNNDLLILLLGHSD